eukprot:90586_1
MATLLFIVLLAHVCIVTQSQETSGNPITWCRINWNTASRQLLDEISVKSRNRVHAPLNIPTQHKLALLTSEHEIKIDITVSFSTQYLLSGFPCDPSGLTLSIQNRFSDARFTDVSIDQQIAKTASISAKIHKNIDYTQQMILFVASIHWPYAKWTYGNWNMSLIFHESLNDINITSKTITVMNVPQSFEVSGSNEDLSYLYGKYSLSVKAQFTLFSTINTNGVYFQDPSNGTTVFTFIYMGNIYPLSQWVFFNNYGELAQPTIASNYSIDDNFFITLPENKIFIDNDASEYVLRLDYADGPIGAKIYNPYLECSVTQYLVNYLSAEGFVSEGLELDLNTQFVDPSAWYHIPECVGKRCVFGVRLNRFDHFLILEYNDYHFESPRWKLLQSWMFCWSLEWWLSAYTQGTQDMQGTVDELPTTVHYLPVSDCSLNQGNALKKRYGANQWMTAEMFGEWLDNLYMLIHRVIQIKDDCRVDPTVLSLSRTLWGAIGQCGRISYVDFDPQIFVYAVELIHMETNMVEWMKHKFILAPSTKLGDENYLFTQQDNATMRKPHHGNMDHVIIVAAAVVVILYVSFLIGYLLIKFYRSKCVQYQSIK